MSDSRSNNIVNQLITAIKYGNLKKLDSLCIKLPTHIKKPDELDNLMTLALYEAISNNRPRAIKILLKRNADANAHDGKVMRLAIEMGNIRCLKTLIKGGGKMTTETVRHSILKDRIDIMNVAFDAGVPIHGNRETLLVETFDCSRETVEALLLRDPYPKSWEKFALDTYVGGDLRKDLESGELARRALSERIRPASDARYLNPAIGRAKKNIDMRFDL
ncbi:MAG: hypothetical protein U9N14_01425 [Pseudomonadota bacterium]|nr:hypothetical protein [Pseudomonadota bacterium]